jgi:precorrin-6Y C5,15-methyltransferase (decarboxylating)
MASFNAPATRWLSIVGIGEDGAEGLSPLGRAAVEDAEWVFGGVRHIALASGLIRGQAQIWRSPFAESIAEIVACRGRKVCVLASGDPFQYGVGATLTRHIPAQEIFVVPAPSAFTLAAARLGWSPPDIVTLSLHGRPLDLVRPHLHPGVRIIALTSGSTCPKALADLLVGNGFGASRLTILEALGGPRERIRAMQASTFAAVDINSLNVVALEIAGSASASIVPLTPGLPDDMYESDGQLTKREIRALTLASLAPRRGETLWDIGAGSGSIGIEWMLCDPSLRAFAVERRADRAERIRRNADALGVPGIEVVQAAAPEALADLPIPSAVFVGGGATCPGVLDSAQSALAIGGRLVVNAVTLETEALLIARHATHGGRLTRFAISRAEPIAGMTGWRSAMPVTQWSFVKA